MIGSRMDIRKAYHDRYEHRLEKGAARMRIEDKMSKLMCQTGACSLVLGILSVIGGLVLGIIGIVNGARLLRHHSDLM